MSDYLENTLGAGERDSVNLHLNSCSACMEMIAGMKEVIALGKSFPVHPVPEWLPLRILANTPVVARETWIETLTSIGRWIIEPRTAIAVFTTTLVLGWLGSIAGVSPDWAVVVRNPAAIYGQAEGLMNRAYGDAIRACYRSPLVTQIQSQIEQLMEIS
jgi:hypothetical protein